MCSNVHQGPPASTNVNQTQPNMSLIPPESATSLLRCAPSTPPSIALIRHETKRSKASCLPPTTTPVSHAFNSANSCTPNSLPSCASKYTAFPSVPAAPNASPTPYHANHTSLDCRVRRRLYTPAALPTVLGSSFPFTRFPSYRILIFRYKSKTSISQMEATYTGSTTSTQARMSTARSPRIGIDHSTSSSSKRGIDNVLRSSPRPSSSGRNWSLATW